MCGLAAFFEPGRRFPEALLAGADRDLLHRGPDSAGHAAQPGWALVFRRLAIMDPGSAADQPMTDEAGRCTLIFNGEIYDHGDWRHDLKAHGHTLKTHCDTEILPHMWEEYSEDMFAKLNGQFAFALFDERKQKFILTRDRFGICPLYWTRSTKFGTDWLIFGSEIKTLLATGMIENAVTDPDMKAYLDGYKAEVQKAKPDADLSRADNFAKVICIEEGHPIPAA